MMRTLPPLVFSLKTNHEIVFIHPDWLIHDTAEPADLRK